MALCAILAFIGNFLVAVDRVSMLLLVLEVVGSNFETDISYPDVCAVMLHQNEAKTSSFCILSGSLIIDI